MQRETTEALEITFKNSWMTHGSMNDSDRKFKNCQSQINIKLQVWWSKSEILL